MKRSIVVSLLILLTFACNRNQLKADLLSEQKILKDSANNLSASVGSYMRDGVYDSATIRREKLSTVYARLIAIQASLDSLEKVK